MTDPVADAARAAADALAPGLGPGLRAEVEAALAARNAGSRRPGQYDPAVIAGLGISAASLIVTIAQLAWSIITRPDHSTPPPPEIIARQISITLRQHDTPPPPGAERIIDVVITEITSRASPPRPPGTHNP